MKKGVRVASDIMKPVILHQAKASLENKDNIREKDNIGKHRHHWGKHKTLENKDNIGEKDNIRKHGQHTLCCVVCINIFRRVSHAMGHKYLPDK